MKKVILIMGLVFTLALVFRCYGQNSFVASKNSSMENLDSLLASYTTMPGYYVRYGNTDCLFELRVNDVVVNSALS